MSIIAINYWVWAADDCYYFSTPESINDRFLYHALLNQSEYIKSKVRKGSIPRISREDVDAVMIPVPPLSVQEEIVRILDKMTELESELKAKLVAELDLRKKQYEYYVDKVLSLEEYSGKVETRILGDIFESIRNGFVGTVTGDFSNAEDGVRYLEGKNIHDGHISNDDNVFVTREFDEKHKKSRLKNGDIVMVQSGHVGESAVITEDLAGSNCHA